MNNTFPHNDDHLPNEMFLLFVDGELPPEEAAQAQNHLDACWDCRTRISNIQTTIADFVEFEKAFSKIEIAARTSNQNFDTTLRNLAADLKPQTKSASLRDKISLLGKFWNQRPAVVAATAIVLIFAIVFQFVLSPRPITAQEILNNAVKSVSEAGDKVFQPVVYQKYQVKKSGGSIAAENITIESWKDIRQMRERLAVSENNARKFIKTEQNATQNKTNSELEEISAPPSLVELTTVLQKNRMDAAQPLAANSFTNWRSSIEIASEIVEKSTSTKGAEILIIKTESASANEKNSISKAELSVQTSNWQPVKLLIETQNPVAQTFEITQTDFEVVSLKNLDARILPTEKVVAASNLPQNTAQNNSSTEIEKKTETAAKPVEKPAVNANANAFSEALKSPVNNAATAEQELEVLRILQEAKADLGEQISVERNASGKILVKGVVETESRKQELITELAKAVDSKFISVNIQTTAELARKNKTRNKSEIFETGSISESAAIPVEGDLRNYFVRSGAGETEIKEKTEKFSRDILSRSRRASGYSRALQKIAVRYAPDAFGKLSAEAQSTRNKLLFNHIQNFRAETKNLFAQLQPIFRNLSAGAGAGGEKIASERELQQAVSRLAQHSRVVDEAVRDSFTVGNSSSATIRNPAFAQSLKAAMNLAEAVENYLKK